MSKNKMELLTLASDFGKLKNTFETAVRRHVDDVAPLADDQFWPLMEELRTMIGVPGTKADAVISEFVRAKLFSGPRNGDMCATWDMLAAFASAYRKLSNRLGKACFEWPGMGRGDDAYGDLMDSLPLAGPQVIADIFAGNVATGLQLESRLEGHLLERFILCGENYINMSLVDALIDKLPSVARRFTEFVEITPA